jgi:deoxycytidine triphosphate deaminase
MFISPIHAIQEGWVTHPQCNNLNDFNQRNFVSPNAIDWTADRLFTVNSQKPFYISESGKTMRGGGECIATTPNAHNGDSGSYWTLPPQTVHDVMSDFYVKIPEGVAALLIIRSTLSRNGLVLVSGIFDSMFEGNLGAAIHNLSGPAYVAPGTRIGQLIFIKSDNAGAYKGGYNHSAGTHWAETQPELKDIEVDTRIVPSNKQSLKKPKDTTQ